ncbi:MULTISPECIES: zinc-binding dehydrogenase [unclassified Frigoribacterium]|uniref:zinc-binding dehydrogenase n=1 Tax=unclassified Frigoribacterium TaxID=2627005 RepID=UPI0018D89A2D|nr:MULTISPECIES: zinc-binding dehydrogenase [unclassified Frigoribacterium]
MPDTMKAIRLTVPVAPDGLIVTEVPLPEVSAGQVRIHVHAFSVNESEVTSRRGESGPDFTFPRILGIEATGTIDAVGEGVDLPLGQKVATMMGGLGRTIDGSYAEYTVVDASNTIPFTTELDWAVVGALPEMLQTAHGALMTGLRLQPNQSVLIHGGTSTVGLTAIAIAHLLGARVIATTRNKDRTELLLHIGADHVLLDDETLTDKVGALAPDGLDGVLEFISAARLPDMLTLVKHGGTVCFVGALSDMWTIPEFSPFTIPNGTNLTSYGGEAADLPAAALNTYLQAIADGTLAVVIANTYQGLDQVADAHRAFDSSRTPGKHVVTLLAESVR